MKRIIQYRWLVIGFSIGITALLGLSLRDISIDPDLKNYFPESMESMVATNAIEERFGKQDIFMIIFENDDIINKESLQRMKAVERRLKRTDGIRKTTSLFGSNRIYGQDGMMFVEPAVKKIPGTPEESERLKSDLRENELVMNIVIADDFCSSAIVITLAEDAMEDSVFIAIKTILEEIPGKEKVHFGGLPYLRQAMNKDIRRDALILVPVALLLMLLFLLLVFREPRGVILPFMVVLFSSILAMSLLPLIGWKFYLITVLVPVMLIAIANDYGIHMMARYQEINAGDNNFSMKEISIIIAKKLWRPILITGLTTVAGIAALLTHTLIPAREMAVTAGIGILAALFYSIVLLPAVLSLMKPSGPGTALQKKYRPGRRNLYNNIAGFILAHNKRIPAVSLTLTLLLGLGILFLKVDSNEENFFPEKHPVKQASKLINSKYGGSENLSIMFRGDMLEPALLKQMEYYEEELLKELEIDLIISFPDVIKEISKALNDPADSLYNAIPPTRMAVAQYMELYNMSGNPGELDQIIDFNYAYAHMIIRINSVNNRDVNRIIGKVEMLTENDENVVAIGGYGFVRSQLANHVVRGQFFSLGIALLIVFLLLSLIFRSLKAGLISSIPLGISIVVLFGIMGYTGIRLDVATALLSSIMIGVGVDYTVHFLWRYREERLLHKPKKEAVITTLSTTGRGIVINAFSVIIGFVVLIISSFTPIRFFGVLVVICIFSCLTGALVILPAMILKYNIKFLETVISERNRSQQEESLLRAI